MKIICSGQSISLNYFNIFINLNFRVNLFKINIAALILMNYNLRLTTQFFFDVL